MKSSKFLFFAALLAIGGAALLQHLYLGWITVDQSSTRFSEYQQGFAALIEHELSQNTAATKPQITIRQITETENELSINYEIAYEENFSDGEKITRNSKGWALLRKNGAGTEWKLYQTRDAVQTMNFTKGMQIGS